MQVAICDDNKEYVDLIVSLVKTYDDKYKIIADTYESGEEFLENHVKYDIVFLDIEMKSVSGIEVASKLRARNDDAIIIFITSHVNYVSDTFRLGAFQFLVKPFTNEDFKLDFERAVHAHIAKHMKFTVKWREQRVLLEYQDIIYIEAYDRHIFLKTIDCQYECVGKLKDRYDELKIYGFARCHQGYIVNLSKIKAIDGSKVIMEDGSQIPISRNYKTEINDAFNLYIAGESI